MVEDAGTLWSDVMLEFCGLNVLWQLCQASLCFKVNNGEGRKGLYSKWGQGISRGITRERLLPPYQGWDHFPLTMVKYIMTWHWVEGTFLEQNLVEGLVLPTAILQATSHYLGWTNQGHARACCCWLHQWWLSHVWYHSDAETGSIWHFLLL